MGHLYFVRHGQTIWNVENKICGATDIALTEFGHEQAVETGRKIAEEGIKADEILYSPLIRAAETARYISEITGIPRRVEPRLIEQNFGKWEGTPRNGADFKRRKKFSPATMKVGNPCFIWHREFIICWMRSKQSPGRRLIFWWHIMELPEWCSPISMI